MLTLYAANIRTNHHSATWSQKKDPAHNRQREGSSPPLPASRRWSFSWSRSLLDETQKDSV
ncbi:hypothetical protein E2320_006790 [Naja naja]|nr:hypothetical protein E2320_006790 [Naja naja]